MKSQFVRIFAALLFISTFGAMSCQKDEPDLPPQTENPPVEEPQPLTESHTMILFMQGDNGLSEFMDVNLQKVISAYYDIPHDLGKIVVFYDRGNYTRLTELYIDDGLAKQRLIMEYNKSVSTVDPEFVKGVFDLIKEEVPSQTYGLVLSSHGGGWVPADIYDLYLYLDTANEQPLIGRSFYGQDGMDCMELPELAQALQGWNFEYIIFDACFMASVEGLYDMRNCADYIIASSAEILGTGFPYEEIVPLLFSTADHSLQKGCESYMELYAESSGTISLIDCSKLESLADVMGQIYEEASSLSVDLSNVQSYEGFSTHLYFDLEQYVEQLLPEGELLELFKTTLKEVVLFTDHTEQFYSAVGKEPSYIDLPRSCGLTTYIMQWNCVNTCEAYLQTSWAEDTGLEYLVTDWN